VPIGFAKDLHRITQQFANGPVAPPPVHPKPSSSLSQNEEIPLGKMGQSLRPEAPEQSPFKLTADQLALQRKQTQQNFSRRVLLLVGSGNLYRLSQIRLDKMDTAKFFGRMKQEYWRLRGQFQRAFSVWRFSHCEFWQVRHHKSINRE
jgi:hypothetical protein